MPLGEIILNRKSKNLQQLEDTSSIFQFVSLSNSVAEIGKFSHFKLHSNLKKNLSILYHALMQCFLSKYFKRFIKTTKSRC